MLDVCMVVYINDILIYSDNMEDHVKHIREVLQRLCQHKLFAKPKKCEFHLDLVEYLGYFLSPNGLTMLEDKVAVICDWPEPCKVKDCQNQFLQRTLMKAEESGGVYTSLGTRQEGGRFEDIGLSVCALPLRILVLRFWRAEFQPSAVGLKVSGGVRETEEMEEFMGSIQCDT